MQNQGKPAIRINLAGMAIGDGLMDPLTQLPGYGDLLYNEGMASHDEWQYWRAQEKEMVRLLREGRNDSAFTVWDNLVRAVTVSLPSRRL